MTAPKNGPGWVKSSLSFANGNCVEVASLPGCNVAVRDSSKPAGAVPRFTVDEWHAFVGGVRNGEFDRFGAQPMGPTGRADQQSFHTTPCRPGSPRHDGRATPPRSSRQSTSRTRHAARNKETVITSGWQGFP